MGRPLIGAQAAVVRHARQLLPLLIGLALGGGLGYVWGRGAGSGAASALAPVLGRAGKVMMAEPAAPRGRPLLAAEYPHIAALAEPLDCAGVLPAPHSIADERLYRSAAGVPILLDPASNTIMSWIMGDGGEMAVHRTFDRLFSRVCRRRYGPPGLFLDVGSNAGFYSLAAASSGCQVVAFDPQKVCTRLVRTNMCLNAHWNASVSVINRPVSNVRGSLQMPVPPSCEGTFFVPPGADKQAPPAPAGGETYTVASVSLDDLLLQTDLVVDVVKIDTEGYELPVLKSLMGMLRAGRVRHMIVEVTPQFWARDGVPRAEVHAGFAPLLAELRCNVSRVLDLGAPAEARVDLGSPEALRAYLVDRQFVQEDLLVSCPLQPQAIGLDD